MYGEISYPGMGTCRPRVVLALFSSPSQSVIGRRVLWLLLLLSFRRLIMRK